MDRVYSARTWESALDDAVQSGAIDDEAYTWMSWYLHCYQQHDESRLEGRTYAVILEDTRATHAENTRLINETFDSSPIPARASEMRARAKRCVKGSVRTAITEEIATTAEGHGIDAVNWSDAQVLSCGPNWAEQSVTMAQQELDEIDARLAEEMRSAGRCDADGNRLGKKKRKSVCDGWTGDDYPCRPFPECCEW